MSRCRNTASFSLCRPRGASTTWPCASVSSLRGRPRRDVEPTQQELGGGLGTEAQDQVVLAPRGRHSEKPAVFRQRLIDLLGDVPRIELFARERVEGWDAWGDEVSDPDLAL